MANHWQDISVDLNKNRVYIPQDVMAKHGCTDADLFAGRETEGFIATMHEIVDHASRGGMHVLKKIRAHHYRVLRRRPAIGKLERVGILLGSIARAALARKAA
jgi:phytoene/squalene synthetase